MALIIGTYDIFSDPWITEFFPEDLPEDWRIEYYANEFDLIHFPTTVWDREDFSPFEEEWPENLTAILEINQGLMKNSRWPEIECWASNHAKLISIVEDTASVNKSIQQTKTDKNQPGRFRAKSNPFNLLRLSDPQFDIKSIKSEVEKLAQSYDKEDQHLILNATPGQMNQIKTLLELMGI